MILGVAVNYFGKKFDHFHLVSTRNGIDKIFNTPHNKNNSISPTSDQISTSDTMYEEYHKMDILSRLIKV